jgi:hypothetical protein
VVDEDEEGRLERMSIYDRQRIEIAKKRIQEQFYSQFKYKPTINEVYLSMCVLLLLLFGIHSTTNRHHKQQSTTSKTDLKHTLHIYQQLNR